MFVLTNAAFKPGSQTPIWPPPPIHPSSNFPPSDHRCDHHYFRLRAEKLDLDPNVSCVVSTTNPLETNRRHFFPKSWKFQWSQKPSWKKHKVKSFFLGGREGKWGFVLRLVLEGGVQVEGKHETVTCFSSVFCFLDILRKNVYNPHDLSWASVSSFSVGVTSGYVIFLPNTLNNSSFSEEYPGIVSHQYQPTSEHWLSLSLYIYI